MIKQSPSLGKLIAMAVFALSCVGILGFLWLAFGGPLPIKPEGYRLQVRLPEAATLAVEADVRLAGVNVGKVKRKALDKRGARTTVELELKTAYAPIPKDSRAMLRQKTLLGETYVELSTGDRRKGMLPDGGTLSNAQVQPTVELDEIFEAFDEPTRKAFKDWVAELSTAIEGGRGQDLNDALGNLSGFAVDGAEVFKVLDEQEIAVRRLIKNTGVVFGALNEREGALRQLIVNANNTFEATASRDVALAETFRIFPTFLDESRTTLARLERFSRDTRPLVLDLKEPADDLGPTVRDLGDLAPSLERVFRDLGPLIRSSRRGVPALQRVLRGVRPLTPQLHTFLQELNPILAFMAFNQTRVACFVSCGSANVAGFWVPPNRGQTQVGIIDGRALPSPEFPTGYQTRPFFDRGNAYLEPNTLIRAPAFGVYETFDCVAAGGTKVNPTDASSAAQKAPPCFVKPTSLFDNKLFTKPDRGEAPFVPSPFNNTKGRTPAVDPNPGGDPGY